MTLYTTGKTLTYGDATDIYFLTFGKAVYAEHIANFDIVVSAFCAKFPQTATSIDTTCRSDR